MTKPFEYLRVEVSAFPTRNWRARQSLKFDFPVSPSKDALEFWSPPERPKHLQSIECYSSPSWIF